MRPPNSRYELKIVLPATALPRARAWIRLNRAAFRPTYPPRFVNNIYFDTENFAQVSEALAGVAARVKVRYRWYGDARIIEKGVLELKFKQGLVGWKRSHPVRRGADLAAMSWSEVRALIRAELDAEFRNRLDVAYRPVLINRYWREYFESLDGRIRATIDSRMSVHPQMATSRPNLVFAAPERRSIVVEVKAGPEAWDELPNILNDFPVRVSKHSKYVSGVLVSWAG